jgi:hypothetical protein
VPTDSKGQMDLREALTKQGGRNLDHLRVRLLVHRNYCNFDRFGLDG